MKLAKGCSPSFFWGRTTTHVSVSPPVVVVVVGRKIVFEMANKLLANKQQTKRVRKGEREWERQKQRRRQRVISTLLDDAVFFLRAVKMGRVEGEQGKGLAGGGRD